MLATEIGKCEHGVEIDSPEICNDCVEKAEEDIENCEKDGGHSLSTFKAGTETMIACMNCPFCIHK